MAESKTARKAIEIYTDGACSGNPGPGGWGAVLCYRDVKKEISGAEPDDEQPHGAYGRHQRA